MQLGSAACLVTVPHGAAVGSPSGARALATLGMLQAARTAGADRALAKPVGDTTTGEVFVTSRESFN